MSILSCEYIVIQLPSEPLGSPAFCPHPLFKITVCKFTTFYYSILEFFVLDTLFLVIFILYLHIILTPVLINNYFNFKSNENVHTLLRYRHHQFLLLHNQLFPLTPKQRFPLQFQYQRLSKFHNHSCCHQKHMYF